MIQREFLDRIGRGETSCPGVVGARNSAAIAIASVDAERTGKPVGISPCPEVSDV